MLIHSTDLWVKLIAEDEMVLYFCYVDKAALSLFLFVYNCEYFEEKVEFLVGSLWLIAFYYVPGSLMKLLSTTCQIVILMGVFSLPMKMFLDFGYQNLAW